MRTGVVVFPGTNRERDAAMLLQRLDGKAPTMLWHTETTLPALDLVVLPGGFSYGDYLRTGAMAAHSPIMAAVRAHAARGGLVLGICNGFQILCETQLLPGILLRNNHLKFNCKFVDLRVENTRTPFTHAYAQGQVVHAPVAHGDGNYFADDATLDDLEQNHQVVFRYGHNPNGSARNIAGIINKQGNVLGLMPHLENAAEPLHGHVDGATMFASVLSKMAA